MSHEPTTTRRRESRHETRCRARPTTKSETEGKTETDPIDYLDQLDIKLDGLKPIQNAAVVILLGGCTISEAAGMVGVHRNTIHRWIKNVPAFSKGLRGAQNEQREAVVAQLDAMGRKAAGAVEQAIDKGDPRIALQLLKGIGLLGDQMATRNPYFKRQVKRSNNKKPDWGRKWQLPQLPRFKESEVMASSILLLLGSLLVVGILNLAQAARTVEKPEASAPESQPASVEGGSPLFLRKIGTVPGGATSHSNVQKLSVSPVVRNPASHVVRDSAATAARLSETDNWPISAELRPASVQHPATFCLTAPRMIAPGGG